MLPNRAAAKEEPLQFALNGIKKDGRSVSPAFDRPFRQVVDKGVSERTYAGLRCAVGLMVLRARFINGAKGRAGDGCVQAEVKRPLQVNHNNDVSGVCER